jgi:hypothetical protein
MKSNLQHRLYHCYSIAYTIVTASLIPLFDLFTASLIPLYIKDLKDIKSFNRTGKRRLDTGLFPLNAMKDNDFPLTGKEKTAYPPQGYAGVSMGQAGDLIPLNGHNSNIFRK